jgi:hypothetical protein
MEKKFLNLEESIGPEDMDLSQRYSAHLGQLRVIARRDNQFTIDSHRDRILKSVEYSKSLRKNFQEKEDRLVTLFSYYQY